jgi:SAM-dependent methyltransferase
MVLYDQIGKCYSHHRRPDPRIKAAIARELRDARSILNVGAGAGSYEPVDCSLVALEPSRVMISQRPSGSHAAIQGQAESLPFGNRVFDASTALLTIHHWSDVRRGLGEAQRVARDRLVILTWLGYVEGFWLLDYLPEIGEVDKRLFPSLATLENWLGPLRVIPVPIPHDCSDGFLCAYWQRPHAYLDEEVRSAISTFSRIGDTGEGLQRLAGDLASGRWHRRHRHLLDRAELDLGYRLLVWERTAA